MATSETIKRFTFTRKRAFDIARGNPIPALSFTALARAIEVQRFTSYRQKAETVTWYGEKIFSCHQRNVFVDVFSHAEMYV